MTVYVFKFYFTAVFLNDKKWKKISKYGASIKMKPPKSMWYIKNSILFDQQQQQQQMPH